MPGKTCTATCELAARDIYCEPYDPKRLQEALPRLRALTRENVEAFTELKRRLEFPAAADE